jgi:hypothetical protein
MGVRKFLVLVCVLLPCGCNRERDSLADLRAADVVSVEGFVENRPDRGSDIGPFLASADDYERILTLLRDASEDRQPAKWQTMGWLKIGTRAGRNVTVWLYRTGSKAGAYKIGHAYFRGGSDAEFIRVLADASRRPAE